MRASTIMLTAVVALVIGRWAHNKKAVDAKTVVEGLFAVLVVAFLDQGRTEPVARGFAWLFLAAVLLGADTPLAVLSAPIATNLGKGVAGATPGGAALAVGSAGRAGAGVAGDTGAGLSRAKGT